MSFLRIFTILVLYFLLTLTGSLTLIYSTGSECSPLLCPGPPPIRPSFGTYLSPLVPANCLSHLIPIDACCVGGSVLVNSEPRNIFIDYANCDVYLNTEDFAVSPTVAFPEAIENQTYTFIMVDADNSRRNLSNPCAYIGHWVVANIPGEDFKLGDLAKGNELLSYLTPSPRPNTVFHHYQFFVFQHIYPTTVVTYVPEDRLQFSVPDFLYGNAREGAILCGPISGTQFRLSSFESKIRNGNND